jgi:two-component system sensor histidine kinase ChiS
MKSICLRILSLFFLCSFLLPSCNTGPSEKKQPRIESGILDLRNWDFKKDGIVNLNGNWEFYWEKLLRPENFDKETIATQNRSECEALSSENARNGYGLQPLDE